MCFVNIENIEAWVEEQTWLGKTVVIKENGKWKKQIQLSCS